MIQKETQTKSVLSILLTLISIFLLGCASTTDKPEELVGEDGNYIYGSRGEILDGTAQILELGQVMLLRLENIHTDCEDTFVYVDGKYLAPLQYQGHSNYRIQSQVHTVELRCGETVLAFTELTSQTQ